MRRPAGGETRGKRFLSGCLADGPRYGDAFGGVAIARGFAQLAQTIKHIAYDQSWTKAVRL